MAGAQTALPIPTIAQVALSGNTAPVFAIDRPGTKLVALTVSALYAAVAATTGVNIQLATSPDNVTYTNLGGVVSLKPAATVQGNVTLQVTVDGPNIEAAANIHAQYVRATLTNTDATNAVTVAVTPVMVRGS